MIVATCQHEKSHKHGKAASGQPRYRCALCGKTFVKESAKPIGSMRIDQTKAALAISLMLEGMSIRSIQRLTGLSRPTLADLIAVVGDNCRHLLESKVRGVAATDIQLDEIWSFVGMKEKTRFARNHALEFGDMGKKAIKQHPLAWGEHCPHLAI